MSLFQLGLRAAEAGLVSDAILRPVIRRMCARRLKQAAHEGAASRQAFLKSLHSGEIALEPAAANRQHYELPADFFVTVLGARQKYSCCYFPRTNSTLDEAEEAALELTCKRAELANGQRILELGCGWGSLTLWMARRFPGSQITAISNSASQKRYIDRQAATLRLVNVKVILADMNFFSPVDGTFDRIVSVEMFEHMRNYELLLKRLACWLRPEGKLFVHLFCHRSFCYPFETGGAANWMGRYFFTGGLMPSADLLRRFDCGLSVNQVGAWSGLHYRRTAEAWLANLDRGRARVMPILATAYGHAQADVWFHRWRMFFLAVAELFGFAGGTEWFVSHYLLEARGRN